MNLVRLFILIYLTGYICGAFCNVNRHPVIELYITILNLNYPGPRPGVQVRVAVNLNILA
jgi:hypothetical protein